MKLNETIGYLQNLYISPLLYSVNSLGFGECMCIAYQYEDNEAWTVFFSERGQRSNIQHFKDEEDACDCFAEAIIGNTIQRLTGRRADDISKEYYQVKRYQLLDHLKVFDIPPNIYTINCLGGGNCICLTRQYENDEAWAVFFSKNNQRFDVAHFDLVDDAVQSFVKRVVSLRTENLKNAEIRRKNKIR